MIRLPPWSLAGLLVALLPTAASANYLTFRNDLPQPVTVNTTCTVAGTVYRNRPVTLRSHESSPPIARNGDIIVTLSDPRVAGRVLFQGALRSGTSRLSFSIQPDPVNPGKARMLRLPVGGP